MERNVRKAMVSFLSIVTPCLAPCDGAKIDNYFDTSKYLPYFLEIWIKGCTFAAYFRFCSFWSVKIKENILYSYRLIMSHICP